MKFIFTPKTDGIYRLAARMAQRLNITNERVASDKHNDVFIKTGAEFLNYKLQ